MNLRYLCLFLVGLLSITSISCDLRHSEQRQFCKEADGNAKLCKSRPDWCIALGGPQCKPMPEKSCSSNLCGVSKDGLSCQPLGKWKKRCPTDTRPLKNGKIADLSKLGWVRKKLNRYTISLEGKTLSKELIARIPLADRRTLCGSATTPCSLVWHQPEKQQGWGKCEVETGACKHCQFIDEKHKCLAVNLCSGVICP